MGGKRPTLPTVTYKQQGVQLAGSLGHSGSGTFQNVIRLMAAGRIDMRKMVSARMPLDDALTAFKRLESREDARPRVRCARLLARGLLRPPQF